MTIRLRDLSQGALLHVVVALLSGPMKADQIARKTGKSHETVQRALAALDSEFGLVTAVPDGRWPIWSLRDTSQLELGLPRLLEEDESPAGPVDNSINLTTQISKSATRGRSLTQPSQQETLLPPPLTPQIAESLTGTVLISQLTRLGAHPDQAAKAITAALKRKETTTAISQRIAHLAQYAADHRAIRYPGQWALDYISTGCDLPVDARTAEPDYSGYRPYLAAPDDEADEPA
jgi:hypothetical protein